MRRKTLGRLLVAAALLAAPAASAQPRMMQGGGGGGMPDLSQIVGRPLPDAGMPKGTVSVRVARKMPANAVANVEVSAVIKNAGGDLRRRALKTDDSGRVLFEGIAPGDQFTAEVTVDGERLKSQTFSMPETGGLRTMLISGVTGGGGAAPSASAPAGDATGGKATFGLGATAGAAEPDSSLPAGTLEISLFDENGAPIPNHPIILGVVSEKGEIETRKDRSDANGKARFTDLRVGEKTGYAAVIDWHGLRLNTTPFGMPEVGGVRADIRALARTGDPSVLTIGEGARIVVQMREDALQILEFLPIENTSDKMFDPGPGAFEIPLPKGFIGAQPQENERKVEVRQNHGIAVHGPIVPRRSQLGSSEAERKANEVVFGFVLPYDGDTHVFSQPAPNGVGLLTLIIDQKVPGLTASGPGVGAGQERSLGGHKYWVMPVSAVAAGGAVTFTLTGLPSNGSWGQKLAGIISGALVIAAFAFSWRPRASGGGKAKAGGDARKGLVDRRESLFAELVALERAARDTGTPAPAEQRKQLVARLEQVYRDLAALDERRAA